VEEISASPHELTTPTRRPRDTPNLKKESIKTAEAIIAGIGMVSIGDVLRANLLEKDRKIKELNSMASWQYYENWGWVRK
jgi:hypothetical protein